MKINPGYKINICQLPIESNQINNPLDKSEDNNELKDQKIKEKKVKLQLDMQNKSALNLKSKKSLKKTILNTKKSFNHRNNALNLETNNKVEKSNLSIFRINDMDYPKSSLNVINKIFDKSVVGDKNTFYNKSLLPIHNINKSFHNKGKLNKTKKNFLKLINPNNKNKVFSESQFSVISKKNYVENLEGDSLNLIEKNLQNKILHMGKEADFLEFETTPLEMSINRLHLKNIKPKLTTKRTKKEEDKKKEINSFKRHKTVIHRKMFNKLGSTNLTNSSSEDLLFDNSEKSFSINNNRHRISNNKLLNNLNHHNNIINLNRNNLNNNLKNNKPNNYYKINLMKSDVDGRRSSINCFLKSTHSLKSTVISRSKTASNAKRKVIDEHISPKDDIDIDIPMLKNRKVFYVNTDKFRILSHKKLVYDSLDDEEIIEDAINDNFYLHPDDKIILIIDSLILFFSIFSMFYKPLKLVLNNCDIKETITSLSFDNISNIFIDFIFICDLIINFFKAYYNFDEQLITSGEKIILNYMKNYFIIDFICAIPYYSIIKLVAFKNHKNVINPITCSKYYNHEINDVYQIIELLKLLKMLKCISSENIVTNIIMNNLNQISFFETWSFLLSSVFMTVLVLHLTACVHIFISCTAFPNWIVYKNLHTSPFITIYLTSIYFLITTVTSVGYGDITGNSINEFIFQIFLLIIGIIAYSWLISAISNYVKENNQQNELFNQKIAILNEIKLEQPKLTKELYDKIYLHLEYINLKQKKDKSSLIDSLPHSVRKPLLYEMYKPIIENFNFFKNFKNSEFVNRVISKLKPVLAVKYDLLVEQGEIIEDTIFVKQGRLSLEVKIDSDHPEKSVEKLLNEEYFFGMENNEIYQKSAFGGVISMSQINHNQSFINKKNLYNLYSGNNVGDNNLNHKRVKSIVTNEQGETEIQKPIATNINYIHLRILDIRKNEHFGALLMFLNKRSPLTLRVKTKKAELFFLKKIDAIEISTSYPNIWKRVNRKSFHNLKQIKKIMKKIIKHFCETYGINFDFGTKVMNYNLKNTNINELKKIKSKKALEQNIQLLNKYNLLNKKFKDLKDPRRPSLGILNSQLKMFHNFPKQTNIYTTKTNFEKDIEQLIPKNFERNKNLKNKNNIVNNMKKNNTESNSSSSSSSNKESSEEKPKIKNKKNRKDNPMDCSVSIIKIARKDSFLGYGHQKEKNNPTDNEIPKSNSNKINIKNNILNKSNNPKEINENIIDNNSNNISGKKVAKYGEEETNNLMKFFGTPYYPEDINDEVYPGEIFEIASQREITNNYEQEYSPANNFLLSYDETSKNNFSIKKNKILSQASLNNIDINNKTNNFTINNNYITNNVINNVNPNKSNLNLNLSISKFNLNFKSDKHFQLYFQNKVSDFTIFKQSFEISSREKHENFDIKEINSVSLYNNVKKTNNTLKKKMTIKKVNLKPKKTVANKNKDYNNIVINSSNVKKRRRLNSCNDIQAVDKKLESDSFSSSESFNFDSFSSSLSNNINNNNIISNINNNNNDGNIFICKPQIKNKRNSICSVKTMRRGNKFINKKFKISQNIIIKIKSNYENLNMITNGKFSKSKKLQDCIKNILTKKLLKHKKKKEECISPKPQRIRNTNSLKLIKNKTMAKNIPAKFTKNNLYKVTLAEEKLKKTEVKSLFKKPMISELQDKNSIIQVKKNNNNINNSRLKDSSQYSSFCNSIPKRGKTRKKNDEFLLDYVNKNIRDDNAVLNNPGQFYNGLFNNIMKKVTIKKIKK